MNDLGAVYVIAVRSAEYAAIFLASNIVFRLKVEDREFCREFDFDERTFRDEVGSLEFEQVDSFRV